MRLRHGWFWLLTTLSIGACGGEADEGLNDPGRPMLAYGSRCSVELKTPPVETLEQCTALASISAGGAHLFLELYPDRHPTNLQRYASIVLETDAWMPGRFKQAVGGRIEIGFEDGRKYRLSGNDARPFPIDLNISSAAEADTGDHYYLRGELNAALPAVSGAAGAVELKVVFN